MWCGCGDCSRHTLVHIFLVVHHHIGIVDVGVIDVGVVDGCIVIDDRGVVVVVDHGGIDGGIRDVDVVDVGTAYWIRGNVHLTRS